MLGAALIQPDQRAVILLMPEPIGSRDGTEKNDCERNAAKRFVVKLRQDHPHLKCILTEDSLSSNAPHIATLQAYDLRYILGVKDGDLAICSNTERWPNRRAASPRMSGTIALLGSCIAFALSMTYHSMPRTRTSGSISSSTGKEAIRRSNTSVG